jgi:hypothetical protein
MELEQFMKLAEMDSHKYKHSKIEWSPYSSMWIHRRRLLKQVQAFFSGDTRDPRNLFRECSTQGVKDPCLIIRDELKTDFFVCKHNIKILKKNSPFFRLKFLKGLVKTAKHRGDVFCISKITGIIEKEASRNLWRRINKSTRKARGGLTVTVKVPTADGGHKEYKSKEGVFKAVSPIILERYQSALVAQCHRGKFLRILVTWLMARRRNKSWRAHMSTQTILTLPLNCCSKKHRQPTRRSLLPRLLLTLLLKISNYSGRGQRNRPALLTAAFILGTILLPHTVPTCRSSALQNYLSVLGMGYHLRDGKKASLFSLRRFWETSLSISYA